MESSKSRKIQSRGEKIFDILNFIICSILSLLVLYPLLYILISSLSSPYYVQNGDVIFWVKGFTLDSYKEAFKIDGIWKAYGNSFYYTIFGTFVNMLFTTTGAYVLSKERMVFRKFFTLFVVVSLWFNAGMIPFYLNIKELGMLNQRSTILVAFAINTYNLIIMRSFFEQIPKSLEEAAFIDGASNIKIFASIYLPLSKPALATVSMFYAVSRWNGYFWIMNIIRDDSKIPLQVLLKKLIVDRVASEQDAGLITQYSTYSPQTVIFAVIVIAVIPMLVAYPFIQKYFKTGATLGSVKG